MTTMTWISPSQIGTFLQCETKWGWDKIDRIPRTQSEAQKFGEDSHEVIENYCRSGAKPPHSLCTENERAALAIIDGAGDLKTKTPSVYYEGTDFKGKAAPLTTDDGLFKIPVVETQAYNYGFCGRIDYLDASDREDERIIDYKFLRPWGEPKNLAADPQALIYAHYAMRVFGVSSVTFSHYICYKENPYRFHENSIFFHDQDPHYIMGMNFIRNIAARIAAAKREAMTATELLQNTRHCSAFGGCPHRERCFPAPEGYGSL